MAYDWHLPREGSCRCGQIRIRIDAAPLFTAACHCTGCQRMTGSAFSLGAAFPSTALSVSGAEPVIGGLHGTTRHFFCSHCKSWLFTKPDQLGDIVMVRSTLLDDQRGLEPFMETMTREKLAWVAIPVSHSYETWPPAEAFATLVTEFAASRQ
jgi:hypothetical protein